MKPLEAANSCCDNLDRAAIMAFSKDMDALFTNSSGCFVIGLALAMTHPEYANAIYTALAESKRFPMKEMLASAESMVKGFPIDED